TEAEVQFNKAISLDETSIEARESMAEFFVTSRQLEKAETAYLDLVSIQENSPESRLVLAEFYSKTDRKNEALNVLNNILADAPTYALARYRLGQMYLDRKETALVNEQLDALFKINDDDFEALMLRARLRLQENQADEAVKDLEEVLKKYPSGREALFLISQARLSLGQIDQANAFIADLERYHPNYLKTGLLKIQSAFTAGDPAKALKLSNELIDRANATTPNADNDPQAIQDLRVRGLSSRGLANLDLGKIAEAKTDLQEIVQLSPRSSSAMVNLAKVFVAEQNFEGASELYAKALLADAQNFDAVTGVIDSHIRLNQTAQAHAAIDGLINANSNKGKFVAAFHYLKSTIFSAEKKGAEADRELLRAIEIDENYLPAYSAYASRLVEQNRPQEAIAQYTRALEKRPAAQIYTLLGILEDSLGNTAGAESAYRNALDISPETVIAANNLAWLIADNNGNLDEALQLATMAVSRNQTVPGFYDTLGWVYLKKGLASPAVEQLKKAIAVETANIQKMGGTPNPGYRIRLGMALAKAGDKASARREVEASLRSVDVLSQREVREAKSVLANL
ncbi:MAG: tetratricopeptide repeat protein, partial [Pyrinomonadaceae bacterium]